MENTTMVAARLNRFHAGLDLENHPIPKPGRGEVLVKVLASGLCASDLHIIDQVIASVRMPYTPGHELYGEICKLGDGVEGLDVGQRIVAGIDIVCGKCRYCVTQRSHLCLERVRIGFERNGSHAQYCILPQENVFPISKDIPPAEAAIIPDAVACMYHAITAQGKVKKGDIICILGVGGLGIHGIQIARHLGATVISTSRQDRKLEIAKAFGSDYVINTTTQDMKAEILRITEGRMCDVVFDNIGIENSIQDSLDMLCRGGKVVVVGYNDTHFTALYQDVVIDEKEIIGIRGSTRQELAHVVELVEQGILKPYVYKTYPLAQINEALTEMRDGASLGRIAVLPWEDEQ